MENKTFYPKSTFYLYKSSLSDKKYSIRQMETTKVVHFGAKGYDDYTKHHDEERKEQYLKRHHKNEDWTKQGINTAGFWSRWLLWNEESLHESIKDAEKRFDIDIIY
jgi:hypothetical protein